MAKIKQVIEKTEPKYGFIKGTAKWAQILEVGKFGNYTIDLYGDSVVEMQEDLEALRDAAAVEVAEAGKKYNLAEVFRENDDGVKHIQFKLAPEDFKGDAQKVSIFDVGGTDVTESWDKLIGNGSIVKVKYMAKPYYMASTKNVGISYRVYAIQVIKLEEYTGGGESGFGDESDGDAPFDTGTGGDF